ncbi:uncharacterized protein LOC143062538 [Mytilus galloprovincialis]|uniref:uncharacterized protein LOC143062538 n=1 Tax=Mytilus galloprovincialis TaxID=29158 RepID=UPI003F7CACA8
MRLLVHESILLANSVGARGQRLSTSNPSTDTPAAKGSDGKAAQGDPSTTNQQLQAMRQDLDELKKNSKVLQNIRDHEPLAKKEKFEPEIPDWELKSGFDPLSVKLGKQSDILLVNYKGEITQPSDCLPSAEEVVDGSDYDFEDLSFLDPNFFKAGNLMYCSEQWEKIGCPGEIFDWIKQGILQTACNSSSSSACNPF